MIRALALVLIGCAQPGDVMRLEQPAAAYDCAAESMGVEAPGPVPGVKWRADRWWNYKLRVWADGGYDEHRNLVVVRRFRWSTETLVHEMAHAVRFHRGEPIDEAEAYDVGTRWRGCV